MKVILKTLPTELLLRYDKKFTSEINLNILRDIILRLISSMKLRFKPTYKQVRDWLNSLHKHHRACLMYAECETIDKDNKRLH